VNDERLKEQLDRMEEDLKDIEAQMFFNFLFSLGAFLILGLMLAVTHP
jgi:hypothetical protein